MLKKYSLILIPMLVGSAHAANFDPPDLNLEYSLHQAYQNSLQLSGQNSAQNPTQTQNQDGYIENYQVQRGENLWSLSEMLYGDGNYWPKVWAQNPNITNPHLVRPGHALELLLGSEDQAPAFRFSESGDSGVELTAAPVGNGGTGLVEVPPPEVPSRPLIRIPGSFPAWQEVYHNVPDIKVIDDSKLRAINMHVPDKMLLNGYVQDKPIDSQGQFLETELESGLPVPLQTVYIKLKKGIGHRGMKLLIVRDEGVLKKLNPQVEGKMTARFVEVFGDLEVLEPAKAQFKNKSDRNGFDVFRAMILHATNLTLTNFDLIPGQMEYIDMKGGGPTSPATAQIIGSTKHKASALYGPGDVIFLNRGSNDGLAVGQLMDLHTDRSIRDQGTPVSYSGVSSGKAKIVRVDEGCATAVIINSIDGILQGDRLQEHAMNDSAIGNDIDHAGDLPIEGEPIDGLPGESAPSDNLDLSQ